MSESVEAREAKHGEKMIEIKIRFWTDDISGPGTVRPKHGWTAGVVRIQKNPTHGITPKHPRPFNSLLEVGKAVEQVLKDHGIVLHVGGGMKKYISTETAD